MKLTAETYKEYTKRLEKQLKLQVLGQGAFGKVFQHPTMPKVAVKIVKRDPANQKWLTFCKDHQSNPYVPKLYGVNTLVLDDSKSAYAVFMEKLKPITDSDHDAVHQYQLLTKFSGTAQELGKWDPDLASVLDFLRSSKGHHLDLNFSNVMVRGKHLVVTDPLS